jgi:hypothetical protein
MPEVDHDDVSYKIRTAQTWTNEYIFGMGELKFINQYS